MNKSPNTVEQNTVRTVIYLVVMMIVMIVLTGALTYLIPNGHFDVDSQTLVELPTRGITWHTWLFSPLLVLFSASSRVVIAIILFILTIAGAVHLLNKTGVIEVLIEQIADHFFAHRRLLLAILTFFFMCLGAFLGIIEEVIVIVPLVLVLAKKMQWHLLVALGSSVLATAMGFACAITNPFTIGIAQQLAHLPLFSGYQLRILVFLSVYVLLYTYLHIYDERHQRTIADRERPLKTIVKTPDNRDVTYHATAHNNRLLFYFCMASGLGYTWLRSQFNIGSFAIIACFVAFAFVVALLSGYSLWRAISVFSEGIFKTLPSIVLILLAAAIPFILERGNILGTIVYYAIQLLINLPPFGIIVVSFLLVYSLNFFIISGSAKAFLLLPVIIPIYDAMKINRQIAVLAFQFGDGFSNVLFPTNVVLIIILSMAGISYTRWLKFILPLQLMLLCLSISWLYMAHIIQYR